MAWFLPRLNAVSRSSRPAHGWFFLEDAVCANCLLVVGVCISPRLRAFVRVGVRAIPTVSPVRVRCLRNTLLGVDFYVIFVLRVI